MHKPRKTKSQRPAAKKVETTVGPRQVLDWGSFGYSILPPSSVGVVTAILALIAGLRPHEVIAFGLVCIVASHYVIKNFSARIAAFLITLVLGCSAVYAYREYHSYKIDFAEPLVGLFPLDTDRTAAVGGRVSVAFHNPNDFDIWIRAVRRVTSINRMTSGTVSEPAPWEAKRKMGFEVHDEPILFTAVLRRDEVAQATADFYICYGREVGKLDKSFSISGDIDTRFDSEGKISASFSNPKIKEGDCNE